MKVNLSKSLRWLVLAVTMAGAAAHAAETVKLTGLRGETPIDQTPTAEMYKMQKDGKPLPRSFVQQPPLIPHTIRDYQITKNFNKCMDCHSYARAQETGATKVSITHFKTREGQELSNISPRRWNCTQCHVPQADTKPLVDNTFKPAAGIK